MDLGYVEDEWSGVCGGRVYWGMCRLTGMVLYGSWKEWGYVKFE